MIKYKYGIKLTLLFLYLVAPLASLKVLDMILGTLILWYAVAQIMLCEMYNAFPVFFEAMSSIVDNNSNNKIIFSITWLFSDMKKYSLYGRHNINKCRAVLSLALLTGVMIITSALRVISIYLIR